MIVSIAEAYICGGDLDLKDQFFEWNLSIVPWGHAPDDIVVSILHFPVRDSGVELDNRKWERRSIRLFWTTALPCCITKPASLRLH
jgi:hypothetical protein